MKTKSLLLAMTIALSSVSGDNATAAANDNGWKFTVDPAIQGGLPSISGATSGTAVALEYTLNKIGPLGIVEQFRKQTLPAAQSMNLTMPEVQNETFMEVLVNEPGSTATLFKWRTLIVPEGTDIMKHKQDTEFAAPKDFKQYWNNAKKELSTVKRQAKLTRIPEKDTTTGLMWRVDLASVKETTISCWYYVPRDAFNEKGKAVKKYPAIQIMPGYGAEEPPVDRTKEGYITLSVNPRNHGPSRDFWKSPVEHMMFNIEDPENYYYKLAFLDCLRAMQFLMARPEVDNKRVATEGGSQGGLFAIATAALEPRVKCVVSNVTAFSSYGNNTRLGTLGHHDQFAKLLQNENDPAKKAAIMRSLALTDGANMATMIKVPTQINMGDIDPVCPYVGGIDTLNNLKSTEKEFHISPNTPHAVPENMREWNNSWLKKHIGGPAIDAPKSREKKTAKKNNIVK